MDWPQMPISGCSKISVQASVQAAGHTSAAYIIVGFRVSVGRHWAGD